MNDFILGLDLGTNSIGAAVVSCDKNKKPCALIGLHTRIFQEMITDKTRVPKNKKRREKRGARRLNSRYKMRRAKLVRLLMQTGILPESLKYPKDWGTIFNNLGEPFSLRAKALYEPLTPHQFGRVLMHLLKRRGYRSNRGAKYIDLMKHPNVIELAKTELTDDEEIDGEDKEKKDDRKKVLSGIDRLSKLIKEKECQTLGEFIYKISNENRHEPRRITKLHFNNIMLYADRKMYEVEFNKIWDKQKEFLQLSEDLKALIYEAIFFQRPFDRPINNRKNKVGKCSFEILKRRAPKALLEAQEFRLLQEINDLKIISNLSPQTRLLTQDEKQVLINALNNPEKLNDRGCLTWSDTKKEIGLSKNIKFNLQETAKSGLSGNRTNLALSSTIPRHWNKFDTTHKKTLITDILTIRDKKALFNRLSNYNKLKNNPWSFTAEEAYALTTLELEAGYQKHCLKVINKLLPFMRQGRNYHDACQDTGYLRKDQISNGQKTKLDLPPNVANPVVQKALFETRRLVNAILKTYGRPQIIRIELAREMKASKEHRKEMIKQNNENRARNEQAKNEISELAKAHPEYGINPNRVSREDIIKYRLWEELGGEHRCPYSGKPISQAELFSGEVEVDHIFPLSRSHDDSYLNKILCFKSENQGKGNKTPFEAWGKTEKFITISNLLEKLKNQRKIDNKKISKIKETDFDGDGFVAAQLNDTRYISIAVRTYLEQLGIPIQITTGRATAEIRRLLGLNTILSTPSEKDIEADNNEGNEQRETRYTIKKRVDHRHHAIDAFVTALTDKALFDELTKRYSCFEKTRQWPQKKLESIWGWDNLRNSVKQILMNTVVSHAPNRKISDALHEDTAYGYDEHSGHFVYRKPLNSLTSKNAVEKIRDRTVRELALARLAEFEGNLKKAFGDDNNPLLHIDGKTPIISVRLWGDKKNLKSVFGIKDSTGKTYKYFEYGNNHHVEIIENLATGKREGCVVTTLEAAKRARRDKTAIVRRDHGPEWKFVMSLCINDMLEIVDNNGMIEYYRVQKLSDGEITLRHHSVSITDKTGLLRPSANSLFTGNKKVSKVAVNCLGNIMPCHD